MHNTQIGTHFEPAKPKKIFIPDPDNSQNVLELMCKYDDASGTMQIVRRFSKVYTKEAAAILCALGPEDEFYFNLDNVDQNVDIVNYIAGKPVLHTGKLTEEGLFELNASWTEFQRNNVIQHFTITAYFYYNGKLIPMKLEVLNNDGLVDLLFDSSYSDFSAYKTACIGELDSKITRVESINCNSFMIRKPGEFSISDLAQDQIHLAASSMAVLSPLNTSPLGDEIYLFSISQPTEDEFAQDFKTPFGFLLYPRVNNFILMIGGYGFWQIVKKKFVLTDRADFGTYLNKLHIWSKQSNSSVQLHCRIVGNVAYIDTTTAGLDAQIGS